MLASKLMSINNEKWTEVVVNRFNFGSTSMDLLNKLPKTSTTVSFHEHVAGTIYGSQVIKLLIYHDSPLQQRQRSLD